jgi:predicted dehydrogenase
MEEPQLRWGIQGTSNIARKNWKAIWNSKNVYVTNVASRDLQRGQHFIDECQAHGIITMQVRRLCDERQFQEKPPATIQVLGL